MRILAGCITSLYNTYSSSVVTLAQPLLPFENHKLFILIYVSMSLKSFSWFILPASFSVTVTSSHTCQFIVFIVINICHFFTVPHPRVGPGHSSFPLVHLLPHLFPFLLFSFFHWLYLLYFLFCPSLPVSTRIVPLRFQVRGHRKWPNLGLICCVWLSVFLS